MRSPGLGQGPPAAGRGIRLPRARDPPLLESDDGVAGRRGADATAYFLQRALPAQWVFSWQPARVTAVLAHLPACPWRPHAVSQWVIGALTPVAGMLSGVGA